MPKYTVSHKKDFQNLLRIQKCINVDSENKIIDLQDLLKHGAGNIIVFSKYAFILVEKK